MDNLNSFYKQKCHEIQNLITQSPLNVHFLSKDSEFTSVQNDVHLFIKKHIQNLESHYQERLREEFFGVGPLKFLLSDHQITEIIINNYDVIWIEREGRLQKSNEIFFSKQTYEGFLQRLYLELGQEPTLLEPFLDGTWRNHRLHVVGHYHSLTPEVRLTIRKHKLQPWTLADLEQRGWTTHPHEIEFLQMLVKERHNILIIGPASSGKTSVLTALLNICEENERVIIIEDSQEIFPSSKVSTSLLARFDTRKTLPSITLADLVRQSLRMRPDRLIIGEVRGEEATDLLLALSTGHQGSFGTLHASDPRQALFRLEMLIQMGAPYWSLGTIRKLILLSLNYMILCSRTQSGERKLAGIYKLISLEDSGIIIERVITQSLRTSIMG